MTKYWLIKKVNKKYFLKAGHKVFGCQIGEAGIERAVKKNEGDRKTPAGNWYLNTVYYRPDKVLMPKFLKKNFFKIKKITKNCGWCDDIRSNNYNKYIKISSLGLSNITYEKLWRDDHAYDIIVEISHNVRPTIKNKGSAIFIHCSFSDNKNTAGCIALKKKDLVILLNKIRHNTRIKIQN